MKMSGQILSDGSNDVHVNKRPRRNPAPTTKLLDKNNIERPVLPFQQKSIDDYRAAQEVQDTSTASATSDPTVSRATSPTTSQILDLTSSPPPTDRTKDKRPISEVEGSSDSDSAPATSPKRPPKKKGT
jgi:hypothetical protein